MELKFDVNKLIEYAEEYCPKFCNDFLSNFKNSKAIEVCIQLTIDLTDEEYVFYKYGGGYEFDYFAIIRKLGIHFNIYKNDENFYKDILTKGRLCENTYNEEYD